MAASLDKNKPGPVKRDRKGEPRNAGRRQQSKDPIDEDSLVIKTFRYYQVELDGKHDKHERLVKLSRDVTIESKRIIFLLHRVTSGRAMDDVISEALTKINDITERCLKKIAIELEDEDPYMFLRAYTAGLQEYIEAVTFFHYLQTGKLMSLNEFQKSLTFTVDSKSEEQQDDKLSDETTTKQTSAGNTISLYIPPVEYILGIADLSGELMRYCINSIGNGDVEVPFQLVEFMRDLYEGYQSFGKTGSREMGRKISVMRQSLQKVEKACYTLQVRGSEIPQHMLLDAINSGERSDFHMQEG